MAVDTPLTLPTPSTRCQPTHPRHTLGPSTHRDTVDTVDTVDTSTHQGSKLHAACASHGAGLKTAPHAAAVAKKAARATAEQIDAVLNSPPPQQQAPLARSPPTATLREAAAFGRGLAGHS